MITKQSPGDPLKEEIYLTDGGLETTLIFHYGIELAHFAAFELLCNAEGRYALAKYYQPYLHLAQKLKRNFILETPTWRANSDWGYKLGYSEQELGQINRDAVNFVRNLKRSMAHDNIDVILSGNVGPRSDGYMPDQIMRVEEAKTYHRAQIRTFAEAGTDLITALTLSYSNEAQGIVLAAREAGLPVVISFTVETNGRLPNGETLEEAIKKTDRATEGYAAYFMINCAHPNHFRHLFVEADDWTQRLRGLRANASTKSHAELDESETLDAGDRQLLAAGYGELQQLLPDLKVFGGCCGTDHSHIETICDSVYGS